MSDGQILTQDGLSGLMAEFEGQENVTITEAYSGDADRGISGDDSRDQFSSDVEPHNGFEQRDAAGNLFDRDLHSVDTDGQPKLTKNGYFRFKRGAKANPDRARGINIPGQGELSLDEPSPLAKTAALGYIQTGVMVFGAEWLPDPTKREQEFLTQAFHDFFVAHEMEDLPPGLALAVACFAYAAPRMHQPATQSKLHQISTWVQLKIGGLYYKVRYGARFNHRPDNVRQDNTSQANDSARKGGWRSRFGL